MVGVRNSTMVAAEETGIISGRSNSAREGSSQCPGILHSDKLGQYLLTKTPDSNTRL